MRKYLNSKLADRDDVMLMVIGAIWFCYTVGYVMGRLTEGAV